ncbi:formylglycine-generating enzyme required for sulfatase activity [Mucilaginibacter frigoritolerans]|uniref:Formylglycine-generating enzyme required for sulfatase activity n=1 Tax=Mucilaginibacter frigoritolerans TaxID=652788 RepID=A0A562TWA2_9SPHI|nr:formylglycine-generating enzyme family protein [Mucilaginibacter frigoritolerans]TWI97100.1 formylglycine-generating enzyme required for sulfatase activity [Mucilaginibacter frigoritolerans]
MKNKILLLTLAALTSFAFIIKNTPVNPSYTNMVLVKGGTFTMGLDSTQLQTVTARFKMPASYFSQQYPAIRVTVHAFYLDKYEVTNADYKKFIHANPLWSKSNIADSLHDGNYLKLWNGNKYPNGQDDYPVVYVSWYAASAYAKWVGKRLPLQAEMEYAAKGADGKSTLFSWGNTDADKSKANYMDSGTNGAVRTGTYSPNSLGLYDMAGNVSEFCADKWRQDMYAQMARYRKDHRPTMSTSTAIQNKVVILGGSWKDAAVNLIPTYREGFSARGCSESVGFRCAVTAQ